MHHKALRADHIITKVANYPDFKLGLGQILLVKYYSLTLIMSPFLIEHLDIVT